MNPRVFSLALLGWLLLPLASLCAQDDGSTLQPLPPSALATPPPTPASPVPPALADDLTRFATEELAFQQQDDAARLARFYQFPLQDEGRPVNAKEFRRAWAEYAKAFTHRTLQSLDVKFLSYDPGADTVSLQQTYGLDARPQGHADPERKLLIRQLRIVRAGKPARAIDDRFTVKEFWTYDTRLSVADHHQDGERWPHLADDVSYAGGVRDAVNAIIRQDRVNYYSDKKEGRDPDDEPCAYFDDPAHRDLLYKARLRLIPDTPATLEAILHGTPRVRVSFSDNGRGENRDGYPVLNVGVLDK
ncbi:MAG: hypothetical protein INR65_10790 [Gluconacetobacter diazotrophicus]|nr:hypothetical protein [Gluconacetobacter diazotrophicus]